MHASVPLFPPAPACFPKGCQSSCAPFWCSPEAIWTFSSVPTSLSMVFSLYYGAGRSLLAPSRRGCYTRNWLGPQVQHAGNRWIFGMVVLSLASSAAMSAAFRSRAWLSASHNVLLIPRAAFPFPICICSGRSLLMCCSVESHRHGGPSVLWRQIIAKIPGLAGPFSLAGNGIIPIDIDSPAPP